MFNPLPWVMGHPYWGGPFKPARSKPQDVKEVWFSGVHGDLGGGYPEKESSAIKIPLAWMISQTGTMGLDYSAPTVDELVFGRNLGKPYLPLDALVQLHDPMNFAWKVLEYVPRRVPETSWRKRGNTQGIYLPMSDRRFISGRLYGSSIGTGSKRSEPPDHAICSAKPATEFCDRAMVARRDRYRGTTASLVGYVNASLSYVRSTFLGPRREAAPPGRWRPQPNLRSKIALAPIPMRIFWKFAEMI
jgi:hypothetical protein